MFAPKQLILICLSVISAKSCASLRVLCSADGVVVGNCIPEDECVDGKLAKGLCPGPNSIKCCTWGPCEVSDVEKGNCLKETTCSQTTTTGKCPGPKHVKCCTKRPASKPETIAPAKPTVDKPEPTGGAPQPGPGNRTSSSPGLKGYSSSPTTSREKTEAPGTIITPSEDSPPVKPVKPDRQGKVVCKQKRLWLSYLVSLVY